LDPNRNEGEQNAKFWLFTEIFDKEFNISIGFPRSDLCNECERFNTRIILATQNNERGQLEELKTQQTQHWIDAEHFRNSMTQAKQLEENHFSFCFDFEKNFVLPITGIGREYFCSHLNVYNLGFQNLQTDDSVMCMYPQNFAHKAANEVCSLFLWYVRNHVPQNIQHLHIFSDNAVGTNKNRFIFTICQYLCLTRFVSIKFDFPVPGHSFMCIDRSFALIEKKKKREDRVIAPSTWTNLVVKTRPSNPFHLVYVEKPFTDDLTPNEVPVVRVKDFKSRFIPIFQNRLFINGIRAFSFSNVLTPTIARNYGEECVKPLNLFLPNASARQIVEATENAQFLYQEDTFLPVPRAAAEGCTQVLDHVVIPPNVTFFNSIQP